VGRDNDLTNLNANINEEQFERYARWLKQRREINSLRIKADETNLADIKKKRNILLKKQKQVTKKRRIFINKNFFDLYLVIMYTGRRTRNATFISTTNRIFSYINSNEKRKKTI